MRPGNGEQLPGRILASRAKSPASPHQGAKGHSNCSVCAVMYVGQVRTVRGDKRLDANCCLSLASSLLSPLTV
jgi:hypothetical protein